MIRSTEVSNRFDQWFLRSTIGLVGKEVSETGNVDAHQFEFGREIWRVHLSRPKRSECCLGLTKVEGEDVCHFDTRTDQAICVSPPAGAFTQGIYVFGARHQIVSHCYSAPFSGGDAGHAGQVVSRRDTDSHDDHVRGEDLVVGKFESGKDVHAVLGICLGKHGFDVDLGHAPNAHLLDLSHDHFSGLCIELPRQRIPLTINDRDFFEVIVEIVCRLGGFESQ